MDGPSCSTSISSLSSTSHSKKHVMIPYAEQPLPKRALFGIHIAFRLNCHSSVRPPSGDDIVPLLLFIYSLTDLSSSPLLPNLYSGNIFNGKSNPNQSPVVNASKGTAAAVDPKSGTGTATINKRFHGLVPDTIAQSGEVPETCPIDQSSRMNRSKLCGSLPNYLDDTGGGEGEGGGGVEGTGNGLQLTDSFRNGKFAQHTTTLLLVCLCLVTAFVYENWSVHRVTCLCLSSTRLQVQFLRLLMKSMWRWPAGPPPWQIVITILWAHHGRQDRRSTRAAVERDRLHRAAIWAAVVPLNRPPMEVSWGRRPLCLINEFGIN